MTKKTLTKERRLKGWGEIANAAGSIKDDAKLGAMVREIIERLRAEDAQWKAENQPPISPDGSSAPSSH